MIRIVPLLAAALLSGCGLGTGTVSADIDRLHPGCKLEKIRSIHYLNDGDRFVLAKFTYTCPGDNYLKYGNWVYTKGMDTGFTTYCCVREATAEEL
ncbi:hypothetical protein [Lysobacter sp. CA199]|uniref:hypothetical protein n=1 Tax=Lysobacter sp. CA199 TaxID=3455608 RepID=UPI003F8D57BB